jgi:hypothetical protein
MKQKLLDAAIRRALAATSDAQEIHGRRGGS